MSIAHPNPLEPCPFCGGAALRVERLHDDHTGKCATVVHCMSCYTKGPVGDWKYDTDMAGLSGRVRWNRRT